MRALIVLSGDFGSITSRVSKIVSQVSPSITSLHVLVVHGGRSLTYPQLTKEALAFVTTFYRSCPSAVLLVGNFGRPGWKPCDLPDVERYYIDSPTLANDLNLENYELISADERTASVETPVEQYDATVLGGTYDNIHIGHKVLLSESIMMARSRVLVGIASGSLLAKKKIAELIRSGEERQENVLRFLRDAGRGTNLTFEAPIITDFAGPAASDPDLQCLVLSAETRPAWEKINGLRANNNVAPLGCHVISNGELLEGLEEADGAREKKVSSSNDRIERLGTLLQPVTKAFSKPYVIGLTGGSCSGKSSVATKLKELHGVHVIDCDKLGHEAYLPGTECMRDVENAFGKGVIREDGTVNRAELGRIVFSAAGKLEQLNSIVWPHIKRMSLANMASASASVVVLDAAVLLEAGWDSECHEVWVCSIPREEQLNRIMQRDSKSAEEANKRLDSQMPNEERVRYAHVLLTTIWDHALTNDMVTKAYKLLLQRANIQSNI